MSPNNNYSGKKVGDRRLGFDRRQFSYSSYFPERRKKSDRRLNDDGNQRVSETIRGRRRLTV